MPHGAVSIRAEAGVIPIAAIPAIPPAVRKPRRVVSIFIRSDSPLNLQLYPWDRSPGSVSGSLYRASPDPCASTYDWPPYCSLRREDGTQQMAGKNTAVFGIYANRLEAEEAVENLRRVGFRSTDVSVLFPDNQGTKDFAHEKNTKAPEGVTTGVAAGGVAGGVLGWLTGIGALAIPGLGAFIAAGPIVAALAGAGAIGTLGALIGALIG